MTADQVASPTLNSGSSAYGRLHNKTDQ